ncbi:MAG: V-type ATP synthase subunit A [Spirochaetaceae bacterium]|nr:V-type ATP synthase subunit A [Spirochaetaceae bacterium]
MSVSEGVVQGINGNMAAVNFEGAVSLNEVGYIVLDDGSRLKSEVIRIRGNSCQMQVFEMTRGVKNGDKVEFTGELLSSELGPGLIGQVYDGLQNPLPELAAEAGLFLKRGLYLEPLSTATKWAWTPTAKVGEVLAAGDAIGFVPETQFKHIIMLPFNFLGTYTLKSIKEAGSYTIRETIAEVTDERGQSYPLTMSFHWPVKRPIRLYAERLMPREALVTQMRIIDTFLPVAKGGTFCTPGPFGAGKTVLQHMISKNADVDIVIVAACGERAGEVVETLREFPDIVDPRSGKSLMDRTIIICNTSSMPVASREASVYTAVTMAEYYRQMGLDVLLLADSTSRWAQAMREMSGRLEEIPGDEAFPAYLESTIASFYERAGLVQLKPSIAKFYEQTGGGRKDGKLGSVTIGGSVSPAGGNFEEPVTQATLKVVGCFLGLSYERSYARKYPAIHPVESWSKYKGILPAHQVDFAHNMLLKGVDVEQMMKVLGEDGVGIEDFEIYLKEEFLDAVYLQQNSFDKVDNAASPERQRRVFDVVLDALVHEYNFKDKDDARAFFNTLRQKFIDWNSYAEGDSGFAKLEAELKGLIQARQTGGFVPGSAGARGEIPG